MGWRGVFQWREPECGALCPLSRIIFPKPVKSNRIPPWAIKRLLSVLLTAASRWPGLLLGLLSLAVLARPLTRLPLIRSEAMYALIPQEMLAASQWLVPTLNGVPYLDKPPLVYWLTLLSYKFFGVSEGAARLGTLLCAAGEVWCTYLLGVALFGPRAACLGGLVLLSSVGFFALHLQILTDHLITLSLTASLYALWRWQERPAWFWTMLFYVALTLGFLSKGLIGLAFPLMIGAAYPLVTRRGRLLRLIMQPLGWLLLAGLSVPWFMLVEKVHPGFLHHHFLNEQILRFLGKRQPLDIVPFSLWAFWLFLGLWLLPWTLLLPESLWRFWRDLKGEGECGKKWFLLLWAGVIMGFFSLSESRIEYYSLPALPALALILGWRLEKALGAVRERGLMIALLVLAALSLATHLLLPFLEELCAGNRREFVGLFAMIQPIARQVTYWVPILAGSGAWLGRRHPRLALGAYGAVAGLLLFFTYQTMSVLSPLLSDKIPGDFVRHQAGPQDLLVMENIEEYEYGASLAFYARRRLLMVQRDGLPRFPEPVAPEQNYLISPEQLAALWEGRQRVFVLVDEALAPAPPWEGATAVLNLPGKRLVVNRWESLSCQQSAKEGPRYKVTD